MIDGAGAPASEESVGTAMPSQRSTSRELAAIIPGAKVVEALQLPHSDASPQSDAIPYNRRVGTTVAVPVAPAKGSITQPAGSFVAVVVKRALDSPTIRVALVVAGVGLLRGGMAFVAAFNAALAAGHHFFQIAWADTFYTALDKAWGFFAGGGAMAVAKAWDNNPIRGLNPAPAPAAIDDETKAP